ncbi:MAG: CsgG/HfaB family protein [Planctomyces sp.]
MRRVLTLVLLATRVLSSAMADETAQSRPPLAVFPFEERGSGTEGTGRKISDFLTATLATDPELVVVERAELNKLLEEQKLSVSGLVKPDEAVQVGRLTGAKLLILGSVIELDSTLIISARITGTETGKIVGAKVKGKTDDDLAELADKLAEEVVRAITSRSKELIAAPIAPEDRAATILKVLGDRPRPVVWLKITERHVGQATIDPAAETEIARLLHETGFTVIDHKSGDVKQADIVIEGEGFSEFATRQNDLNSVRARVEVTAVRRESNERIFSDRQTEIVVNVTEQIAGKSALQNAAGEIALRLLPKLVQLPQK